MKWLNEKWNKRRTSTSERKLKRQVAELEERIESLEEDNRQLELERRTAEDNLGAEMKKVEFLLKAVELDQKLLDTITRQHGMKAMPEERA